VKNTCVRLFVTDQLPLGDIFLLRTEAAIHSAGAKSVQAYLLPDRLPMKSTGETGQQQAGAGGGRRDGPSAPLETLLVERGLEVLKFPRSGGSP
jgi:hypothetical protein